MNVMQSLNNIIALKQHVSQRNPGLDSPGGVTFRSVRLWSKGRKLLFVPKLFVIPILRRRNPGHC